MAGCHLSGWVLQPESQRYLLAPAALMAPRGLVPACREPRCHLPAAGPGTGQGEWCCADWGPNSFLFLFKLVSFVTRCNKIIFLKS